MNYSFIEQTIYHFQNFAQTVDTIRDFQKEIL
jgi:hypothetical protein